MEADGKGSTRRELVIKAGRLASAVSLTTLINPATGFAAAPSSTSSRPTGDWDLSWVNTLAAATDRAVFDWPSLGDPADPQTLYFAERYLNNCKTIYAPGKYDARVVLNIRTQAVPAALNDATWERFALGKEYNVKDPVTQKEAVRNPFWHRAPDPAPGIVLPTIADLMGRGAIILVCDFALTHLAERIAGKANRDAVQVHTELRSGFVPGAFLVPSGIFGLAKAQNAGCAYIRL
jgi:hypothetical protein